MSEDGVVETGDSGAEVGGSLTLGLASMVREEILSGKWPHRARLPADTELARTFGVGINTVRRALSSLAAEGLLERRRGSGTYVIGAPAPRTTPRLIGLFVPSIRRYFADLVAGVESVVHAHGGHLLLRATEYNPTREPHQIDELLAQQPDGLIMTPTLVGLIDPEVYVRRIESIDVPVVLAERVPVGRGGQPQLHSPLSTVTSDTHRGGHLAVQHLYDRGCRRIGLMSSRGTPTSEGFHRGFIEAAHDLDVTVDRGIARWPHCSVERMEQNIGEYAALARTLGLDGIVCHDDLRAKRLLPHLEREGLAVPDDVAIIAYEDHGTGDAVVPLTAVVPSRHEVGRLAAQVLISQIERGTTQPATQVVVAPQIVERASTRRTAGPGA